MVADIPRYIYIYFVWQKPPLSQINTADQHFFLYLGYSRCLLTLITEKLQVDFQFKKLKGGKISSGLVAFKNAVER